MGELYGHSDKFTLEWKNGILARILLNFFIQTELELSKVQDTMEDTPQPPPPLTKPKEDDGSGGHLHSSAADIDKQADYFCSASLSKLPDKHSLTVTASSCRMTPGRFGMGYPACAPVGWRWALLDGPVDSEWIENLNSVLDDSMVLCLSNGERIKLMPGSRILFESDHLANASPATVSRCAIIFLVSWLVGLCDA